MKTTVDILLDMKKLLEYPPKEKEDLEAWYRELNKLSLVYLRLKNEHFPKNPLQNL